MNFSKTCIVLIAVLLAATAGYAQQQAGDNLVTVPQKYVSSEGLQHQSMDGVSKWVGIGREVGIATKEGLDAVVTESEKFGTTKVGNFIMFMVAWKIIGHELVAIVIGIPMLIGFTAVWWMSMRRFFFGRRMLIKHDKTTGKEWKMVPPYEFNSSEARAVCGFAHAAVAISFTLGLMIYILG